MVSLAFLTPQFIFLTKWGGYPFTFSLLILVFYLDAMLKINDNSSLYNHLTIIFIFMAISLTHFNTLGFALIGTIVIATFNIFKYRNIKKVYSLVIILFFFALIEVLIAFFDEFLFLFLTQLNLGGSITFFTKESSWLLVIWSYIRKGQTGEIGLFSFGNVVINLILYYFSFFYFSFLFSFLFLITLLFKKRKNIDVKLFGVSIFFISVFFFLSFMQIQIFTGRFIRFPLANYLFRIERVYEINNIILAPIISGKFVKEHIYNFKNRVHLQHKKVELFYKLRKNIKNIKHLRDVRKYFFIIVLLISFSIYSYIIPSRTAISYNDDVLASYAWIKNYNGSMVILNDPYGQFIPLYVYPQNKTICYPFYSSADMSYTETTVFELFSAILKFNDTYTALTYLYNHSITHIFVSDDRPNYLAMKMEEIGLNYSIEIFNKIEFLTPVFSQGSVSIFEVSYNYLNDE
ncbi:MAG: hypothetical protein K9W46_03950 [Candidatus Heimdallarchaeum endolithica]|uniref:Uncharacterized protein n=1 Tax=Candidatus Heimdallarchaeum endolithica TaxID=2876572 RepID=A0A9Y1FQ17_9ARCH|nr:MAG: hypothetical protein K9W46_03950 [Candidatus Heimdallarchaeum endolithica]